MLRKLGAGLDDLLPSISASHSKLKVILQGLKAEDDGRQLVSLNELCELLSIGAGAPAPAERDDATAVPDQGGVQFRNQPGRKRARRHIR